MGFSETLFARAHRHGAFETIRACECIVSYGDARVSARVHPTAGGNRKSVIIQTVSRNTTFQNARRIATRTRQTRAYSNRGMGVSLISLFGFSHAARGVSRQADVVCHAKTHQVHCTNTSGGQQNADRPAFPFRTRAAHGSDPECPSRGPVPSPCTGAPRKAGVF